jgi:hypothetical protein
MRWRSCTWRGKHVLVACYTSLATQHALHLTRPTSHILPRSWELQPLAGGASSSPPSHPDSHDALWNDPAADSTCEAAHVPFSNQLVELSHEIHDAASASLVSHLALQPSRRCTRLPPRPRTMLRRRRRRRFNTRRMTAGQRACCSA